MDITLLTGIEIRVSMQVQISTKQVPKQEAAIEGEI
jgi:hypothetical protein